MAVDTETERQLNPRVTVPEAPELIALWPAWAAATRAVRPHRAGIPYGPHPRETVDVFPAENPRGAVVFLHGGYWRALSKDEFSWVADGFVPHGLSVVVVGYPLCPEVRLTELVASVTSGFAHVWREILGPAERDGLVVAGHSAGGYLTAALMATDWTAHGLPRSPIRVAVPISGVFELAPLMATSINDAVRLDAAEAAALTLTTRAPPAFAQTMLVVGGDETEEFHRQSEALAAAWADLQPWIEDLPGRNHFTVLDGLRHPEGELTRRIVEMLV